MEIERNVNRTSDPDTQTALLRSSTWKNHGSDSLVTGSEYTANDQGAENDSTAENSSNQTPPSSYRHAKTLATFISFAGIGLLVGGWGPSLLNLAMLLNTDLKTLGATMVSGSVGYCLGSFVGGVLMELINAELLFGTASLLSGVAFTLQPWSVHLAMFVVLDVVKNAGCGILDAGGQAYMLRHWHGAKHREPLFQALHAIWSVGATIGPFIVRPFLVSIQEFTTDCLNYDNVSMSVTERSDYVTEECNITSTGEPPNVGKVRYGFAIIGVWNVMAAVYFYIIFYIQGPYCILKTKPRKKDDTQEETRKEEDRVYKVLMLGMLFVFYLLYLWVEGIPGQFLPAFVVKGLGWNVQTGSLIASLFWGTHCVGRIIGVPVATILNPRQMLIGGLVLSTIALFLMSVFAEMYDAVMWTATALAGLSMSCTFASGMLWASGYIHISGVAASVILIGASMGGITGTPVTAYLSETYTFMWIPYLAFLAAVADIMVYVIIQIFAVCFPRCHHSSRTLSYNPDSEPDIKVELQPMTSSAATNCHA